MRCIAIFSLAVAALGAQRAVAQSRMVETVLKKAMCEKCALQYKEVGEFGGAKDAPASAGRDFRAFSALPDGGLLGAARRPNVLWEFMLNGAVVRQYAKRGEGPGELTDTGPMRLFGDTIAAYDQSIGRLSYFKREGTFIRSVRLVPGLRSILPMPNTTTVASGRVGAIDRVTREKLTVFPLHIFRKDSLIRSFGEMIKDIDPRNEYQFERILIPYQAGFLAISKTNRYVIEYWDATGSSRIFRLVREPEWFQPYSTFSLSDPKVPPSSVIVGAWLDATSRLWVVIRCARSTWKDAYGPETRMEGGMAGRAVVKPELLAEDRVEVIDLAKKELVFSGLLPVYPAPTVAPGNGIVFTAIDAGEGTAYKFYQLSLRP